MKIPTFFNKIGLLDKLLLTKHLALMIRSGITISEALSIIKEQSQNPAFKKILANILADVENGQSLDKAFSHHPGVFDPFFINVVHIGEQSGNLEKNLEYLAEQIKKTYDFQKRVQGALLYPVIVLLSMFVSGGVIIFIILPKLVDLFTSLEVKLPLSTRVLLFIGVIVKQYGYVILAIIILIFLFLHFLISLPKFKILYHKLLLRSPVIGIFLIDVELAFFCRNLGMMLKSGLPIITALSAQAQATTNLVFQKYIKEIGEAVNKGQSISTLLNRKKYQFVPLVVTKMIGVGEKTGKLDESLLYLADFYENEVDNYSKDFTTILEPIVLICVGLGVAFVALAIISPIYELTSGIHR